jgi:micrococcal nuclease
MYRKVTQGTLLVSLLLNGLFLFMLTQSDVARAPEVSEANMQEEETVASETEIFESGHTYPLMRIVDGDTIIVGFENATEYVRLIGINAPELNDPGGTQCYAQESSTHLQEIARTGLVVLHFDETQGMRDSYGRLLAYVELPEGGDLGEQMLRDGYAREYTYNATYARQSAYIAAEQSATEEGRGLWAEDVCQ